MADNKKAWKEWAVEYVNRTGRCVGDTPNFGTPTDMVTEAEFNLSISSIRPHKYDFCHFKDEVIPPKVKDAEKVEVDESDLDRKVDSVMDNVGEVMYAQRMSVLKKNLHIMVDRIKIDDNGKVYVPRNLLEVETFIKESLSSK